MAVAAAARTITIAEALNEAIRLEMRADPKIIIMGEDIAGGAQVEHLEDDEAWGGVMGVTKGLVHEFGRERVMDTPISEDAMTGVAIGAALAGMRPVHVHIRMDFLLLAMNQLLSLIHI